MDISLEHLDLLLHVANDASLGSTFSERMNAVSESLLALVPGSSMSMIVLDPGDRDSEIHAFLKNNDPEGAVEYAAHYIQDDPLPGHLVNTPGTALRLSDMLSAKEWGKDSFTGEFLPRQKIKHMLGFVQPLPDRRLLQVAIHRERALGDFNRSELSLLKLASFDLGRSAFGVLLREKLARSQSVLDDEAKVGILVFNPQGFVEHADGGARAIVRRLGREFPMENLLGDVRAVRALQQTFQRSIRVGESVLIVRSRPLERGKQASVMVVMEVRSPEPALDFASRVARYKLTPRERDAAQRAVLGLTNQQIAGELGISPATVSVHLTRVFRKVGVNGRIELTRVLTSSERD